MSERTLVATIGPAAAAVPRVTLDIGEACAALGVSWDFWRQHIAPEVRVIRRGRKVLVAVAELQRWAAEAGERLLEEARHR